MSIYVTQENKCTCEKCGLTVLIDKVTYPQGSQPFLSRIPSDWVGIERCGITHTFCHRHKIELKGQEVFVDGEVFNL